MIVMVMVVVTVVLVVVTVVVVVMVVMVMVMIVTHITEQLLCIRPTPCLGLSYPHSRPISGDCYYLHSIARETEA